MTPPLPLRVTAISDTHCKFPDKLLGGDLLVHAGDSTHRGRFEEVKAFMEWLKQQLTLYRYVVFTGGNHECSFEERPMEVAEWMKPYLSDRLRYLNHESTEIEGYHIFGSPYTPAFGNGWAFNVRRGLLHNLWKDIPDSTDLLLTHGPASWYGDFVEEISWGRNSLGKEEKQETYRHEGCAELRHALKRVQPQFHVSGHLHAAYGTYYGNARDGLEGITFINASLNSEEYKLVNAPVNFIIDHPKSSLTL